MKRKVNESDYERGPGRRQPQISCGFCRKKKLKCDRGAPCTNCAVRDLPCGRPASTEPAGEHLEANKELQPRSSGDSSVLARLKRLEDALFGTEAPTPVDSGIGTNATATPAQESLSTGAPRVGSSSATDMERQQKARSLDSTFTKHDHKMPLRYDTLEYRISPKLCYTNTPHNLESVAEKKLSINIVSREEALLILHDFVHNPLHLLPIIHEPTVRSLIHSIYDDLSGSQAKSPNPAHVALLFSLAATCASFYHGRSGIAHMFTGEQEASEAMMNWLQSAMDLFDQSQRAPSFCLEDIQARVILSYVFYNIEGCSSRFRYLHTNSIFIARDMGLHLVDSSKTTHCDDKVLKEIKRRIWWYIASTDWMLGFMGDPLDGTYSVQRRHMNVRPIRNINDRDLETQGEDFVRPENVPTDMSFLIQRTRLAEICRQALDSRTPGAPDEDLLDIDGAVYLDDLFEKALGELPPFFQPNAAIPANAPRCLELQRDTVLLAIHSRRARIHRRYLLSNQQDPRSRPLRETCFKSARTVVSLATKMLDPSQEQLIRAHSVQSKSLSHRMGVVVGHLFMGCTMLALKAGTNTEAAGDGDWDDSSEIYEERRRICRILTRAGEGSPIAAALVRDLKRVLRQNCVQGLGDGTTSDTPGYDESFSHNLPTVLCEPDTAASITSDSQEMGTSSLQNNNPEDPGTWTDLLNTMSSADLESWDDLFAGLDSYCGAT